MFAGFDLAIQEINDAGGVLGHDVVGISGDSGDTTTDQANQTADRMLAQNVDAIIGTASSSVTLTIIDKVVGAGVVLFSPANTSPELTDYPDKGLYFRTAPPDIYQGDVLGQFVVNEGNQTVAILRRNDSYGTGLGAAAAETIANSGGEVVYDTAYETTEKAFDGYADEIVAADPDAIIVIGFDESSLILRSLVEKGIGPRDKHVYGCDGNIGNALGVELRHRELSQRADTQPDRSERARAARPGLPRVWTPHGMTIRSATVPRSSLRRGSGGSSLVRRPGRLAGRRRRRVRRSRSSSSTERSAAE